MKIISSIQSQQKIFLKRGEINLESGFCPNEEYLEKKEEFEAGLVLLNNMLKKISQTEENCISQIKSQMIEMIFSICENILRRELKETDDLVNWIETIFQTAAPLFAQDKVTVFLASEDIVKLQSLFSEISSTTIDIKNLKFLSDKSLKHGDVRIETATGLLNATIKRHLDVMKRSLTKD